MATKAETFRSDEERKAKKKPAAAKPKPKAKSTAKKTKAKAVERTRTDVGALHAAENEKSSSARRASDARVKATRVRGKARG